MCWNCKNYSNLNPTIFRGCNSCQNSQTEPMTQNNNCSYCQNGWGQEYYNYSYSGSNNNNQGCKQPCNSNCKNSFRVKFEGIIKFC